MSARQLLWRPPNPRHSLPAVYLSGAFLFIIRFEPGISAET
uniref:Uncharacterized protein n=1 Tax=Anguilla anguilla TaxID=7936 RepID=A0A0E9T0J9_ANGAN